MSSPCSRRLGVPDLGGRRIAMRDAALDAYLAATFTGVV
jgi:hypothetical protein